MSPERQGESESVRVAFLAHLPQILPSLTLWSRLRIQGRLRQRLDPEDLVQETCVRAYEGYSNYSPDKGSFRAWVFGVANHVLLRELRNIRRDTPESRFGLSARSQDLDAICASQTSITSAVARLEQLEALTEEVEELDDVERWILIYRGLEELPYKDVGERLHLDPEAVRTRWRRILQRLRHSQGLIPFVEEPEG